VFPRGAQFGGLREGADGGRRQEGQTEVGALGGGPFGVGLGAVRVGVGDGRGAGPYRGVAGERRAGAGGQVGPVGGEFGGDRGGAAPEALGEGDDLGGLLAGEGEPAQDLWLDVAFGGGVERDVQQ
jgi:hypothetical protein